MTGGRSLRGPVGGASGDAGVEYRRAVAAFAVAHGLSGDPLPGFGFALGQAEVSSVAIETDEFVDDVRVDFKTGGRSYVQAKRRLTAGQPFKAAVAQWAAAAKSEGGLDPHRDRLVLATASASGSMMSLAAALERCKTDQPGDFTGTEVKSLERLDLHLVGLTETQKSRIRRCAVIVVLDVEEESSTGAALARSLLARVVGAGNTAVCAWRDLVTHCGQVARLRGGFELEGWVRLLADDGYHFVDRTPAMDISRRVEACDRYRASVRQRGLFVDLRPLGLEAPPIPLADLDSSVECRVPGADTRDNERLPWALLRRRRVILTGLPGGGKSVALAAAAAVLVDAAGSPLPILVSLRTVEAQPSARSFLDRVLDVAVADLLEPYRTVVREVLGVGLRTGETALLLDSLDETHDRRGIVVAEIARLAAEVSPDVPILLATRDVAYAQALTLGWDDLRLDRPDHPERAIRGVLAAAAAAKGIDRPVAWIETRFDWVDAVVSGSRAIGETPLMPVLLSLLAVERTDNSLPNTRAQILAAMVEAAAKRRELQRTADARLPTLDQAASTDALIAAFAVEAHVIAEGGGQAPLAVVRSAVSASLESQWGLPAAAAASAANSIVHFWDEIGCLIITSEDEMVVPRLELFLDIGDAANASSMIPEEQATWLIARVRSRRVEPIILAAGLNASITERFLTAAASDGDRSLLAAAAECVRQGASISDQARKTLVDALAADAREPDQEGWRSFADLLDLAQSRDGIEIEALLANYDADHMSIGTAAWHLRFAAEGDLPDSTLLNALAVGRLSPLNPRSKSDPLGPRAFLHFDTVHDDVLVSSARRLLGRVPEATELVVALLSHAPWDRHQALLDALEEAGLGEAASSVATGLAEKLADVAAFLADYDPDHHRRFLAHLRLHTGVQLGVAELARLDELADLFQTLNLREMSGWPRSEGFDSWLRLVEVVIELAGFDAGRLSAEAEVVCRRMDQFDAGPFFSLEIASAARALDGWDRVRDPAMAALRLSQGLFMGVSTAVVAAQALAEAPRELSVPLLEDAIPALQSSRRHRYVAALALALIQPSENLASWACDEDPVLRLVAAEQMPLSNTHMVDPLLEQLCWDEDRAVAQAAVERVASSGAPCTELLGRVASTAPSPWKCDHCGLANPGRLTSCHQCHIVPPNPASTAARLLDAVSPEPPAQT